MHTLNFYYCYAVNLRNRLQLFLQSSLLLFTYKTGAQKKYQQLLTKTKAITARQSVVYNLPQNINKNKTIRQHEMPYRTHTCSPVSIKRNTKKITTMFILLNFVFIFFFDC